MAYLLNTLTALNNRSHCFKVLTVVKRTLAMRRDVNVSDKMIVWYLCMLWIDFTSFQYQLTMNSGQFCVKGYDRARGLRLQVTTMPTCHFAFLPSSFCHFDIIMPSSIHSCHLPKLIPFRQLSLVLAENYCKKYCKTKQSNHIDNTTMTGEGKSKSSQR